ncbi:hypothetical protein TNCV_1193131 [Trichonephila clavipes]|nr:hypothetical protein TNCV_1193131 [Trichonephila clavipes]
MGISSLSEITLNKNNPLFLYRPRPTTIQHHYSFSQKAAVGRGVRSRHKGKFSREVGGRGREVEAPDHPQSVILQNWSGTEQNRTVTCMVLKAKANDRRSHIYDHVFLFSEPTTDFAFPVLRLKITSCDMNLE